MHVYVHMCMYVRADVYTGRMFANVCLSLSLSLSGPVAAARMRPRSIRQNQAYCCTSDAASRECCLPERKKTQLGLKVQHANKRTRMQQIDIISHPQLQQYHSGPPSRPLRSYHGFVSTYCMCHVYIGTYACRFSCRYVNVCFESSTSSSDTERAYIWIIRSCTLCWPAMIYIWTSAVYTCICACRTSRCSIVCPEVVLSCLRSINASTQASITPSAKATRYWPVNVDEALWLSGGDIHV